MRYTPKFRAASIYGSMLRVYPAAFQKQYGTTMQQTFGDMIEGEQSGIGKSMIWLRTLFDLPVSAAKQHLINGKDVYMSRGFKLLSGGAFIAVLLVGVASFWEGNLHGRQNVVIERVSAAQLADAMQADDFYSTYGEAAVLFSGKISNVQVKGDTSLVTFSTGRPYNVVCQYNKTVNYKAGQTISVAAPAGSADRETHGVLLHRCTED